MDTERCWAIIEAARAEAGTEWDELDERLEQALVGQLVRLPLSDIVAFEARFEQLRSRVDREDLFMAAFLIHNGCGDDSFTDFCAGVVGLGRDWYGRALADPDNLAGHPAVQGVAAGTVNTSVLLTTGFQFAPLHAYEQLSEGDDGAYYQALDAAQKSIPGDDIPPGPFPPLPRRLQRLAAMFPQQQVLLDQFYPDLTGAPDRPTGSGRSGGENAADWL